MSSPSLASASGGGKISAVLLIFLAVASAWYYLGEEVATLQSTFLPTKQDKSYKSTDAGLVFTNIELHHGPPPFPNLLVVGAEQGGVPELGSMIASMTNDVCAPPSGSNAVNYFSTATDKTGKFKHGSPQKGKEFYASHYRACQDEPYHLDATANYFYMPEMIANFYKTTKLKPQNGDVKVIIALREPVAREYDYFQFKAKKCLDGEQTDAWCKGAVEFADDGTRIPTTFSKYIQSSVLPGCKYPNKAFSKFQWCRGQYVAYLRLWMQYFERGGNILVLRYEDIVYSPDATMNRVRAFLGISLDTEYKVKAIPPLRAPEDLKCQDQDDLMEVYSLPNLNLYLELSNNPGPAMERTPFPKFKLPRCSWR